MEPLAEDSFSGPGKSVCEGCQVDVRTTDYCDARALCHIVPFLRNWRKAESMQRRVNVSNASPWLDISSN
jgi:hypothetical protein